MLKLIADTKAQITQLQVEALDIKSRIRSSGSTPSASTSQRVAPPTSPSEQELSNQLESDLSGNHSQILEKMMSGDFEAVEVEDEVEILSS